MGRTVDLPSGEYLADGAKLGGWWHDQEDGERIVCDLCPRECMLKPGDRGFCFVRENRDGQMVLNTYGRSTGFCIDPIEKKPLNHFYPGTSVLSFGTAGCNLGCKFCQNWDISKSREIERLSERATPEAVAQAALQLGCRSVAFTYNDPVVWAEYAIDTAKACREVGVKTVAVTAGYITKLARGPFYEVMDAANVDLKGFTEEFYYKLTSSHLQPVLDTLAWLKHETNVWFEITNLIIPQANDSHDELRQMCDWILNHVGDDVPVHFTAFHPDFRMRDRGPTPPETLVAAHDIALRAGLKYPYVGNVNDVRRQSTYCPNCRKVVIERDWYELGAYHLNGNRCTHCGGEVAGHFDTTPGKWGRQRMPVRIAQYNPPPSNPSSNQLLPIVERAPAAVAAQTVANPHPVSTASRGNPMSSAAQPSAAAPRPSSGAPQLTPEQELAIHRAAGELITAAIVQRAPRIADPTLAGAAREIVQGVFASLKRAGRLRSCCGFVGQQAPLAEALQHACVQTATRDVRLPPISPTELKHLDLETWLLFGESPVAARGEDRVSAVTIGRHGLKIQRGSNAGLLLPGVAVEHHLDARQFLEHVCVKAGLPTDAWKQDDTVLLTFEGHAIHGKIDAAWNDPSVDEPPAMLTAEQLAQLADWCRENITLVLRGATANFYLVGGPDGTVSGADLLLRVPGHPDIHLFQLSLRPGVPLQSTLFKLAEGAAQSLRWLIQSHGNLPPVQMALSVFYDPAMHGTLAEPDFGGLDPAKRGLLLVEHGRTSIVFDPALAPIQLAERAALAARAQSPPEASLFSVRTQSTAASLVVSNLPAAQPGSSVRPPAVAGSFYPAEPEALAAMVDELLAGEKIEPRKCAAVMVPHAGLRYSGRIAGEVLRRTEIPGTVIIIGPKHTRNGVDWAVAPHEAWSIPGGQVPSDPQLARELAAAIPGLQLDAAAHQSEHGIEVELPLIARLAPQAKVVGIAIGAANLEGCRQIASGLARVLRQRPEPILLVISSDMNHYAPDAENRRLDELALVAMETLDAERLFHTVRENKISMCGVLPAVIVMETLRELGQLGPIERVAYATSGDVSGDRSRVVGYAGLLLPAPTS